MSDIGTLLEAISDEERAVIVTRLQSRAGWRQSFYESVIEEIGRRLRTMPPETFLTAACDILRQSRIEPEQLTSEDTGAT